MLGGSLSKGTHPALRANATGRVYPNVLGDDVAALGELEILLKLANASVSGTRCQFRVS